MSDIKMSEVIERSKEIRTRYHEVEVTPVPAGSLVEDPAVVQS